MSLSLSITEAKSVKDFKKWIKLDTWFRRPQSDTSDYNYVDTTTGII